MANFIVVVVSLTKADMASSIMSFKPCKKDVIHLCNLQIFIEQQCTRVMHRNGKYVQYSTYITHINGIYIKHERTCFVYIQATNKTYNMFVAL